MQHFQLEGFAVVDIVADVFFARQYGFDRARRSWPVEIGDDPGLIQPLSNFRKPQILVNQPAKHLVDLRDLLFRPRHQNNSVGLKVLVLAKFQRALDLVALVNQHLAQPIARGTALAEPQFDQAALASKDLDRQLAAVFPGHGAFNVFDDGRIWGSVIFKLLGAISDLNARPAADVFVIGALVSVLKPALAADIVNQNNVEIGNPGFNIGDQLYQRRAPAD
jgi:hypothetical protein